MQVIIFTMKKIWHPVVADERLSLQKSPSAVKCN